MIRYRNSYFLFSRPRGTGWTDKPRSTGKAILQFSAQKHRYRKIASMIIPAFWLFHDIYLRIQLCVGRECIQIRLLYLIFIVLSINRLIRIILTFLHGRHFSKNIILYLNPTSESHSHTKATVTRKQQPHESHSCTKAAATRKPQPSECASPLL